MIVNRLDSIAREMGLVLERSARSPIFAEACDFACGICDSRGELVSQLNGIPILASAGSFSVQAVLARYGTDISDGDVFIVNDPYRGGNHLPDIGIITPVFAGEQLLFFSVSRAHHGDIGGSVAGSYNSRATEIFQEGLRIPPTRLARKGEILVDVLELITYNTRNPQMLKSDLSAQIGANEIARQRISDLLNTYSPGQVEQTVADYLDSSEALAREKIAALPDGTWLGEELVDDDGFQPGPIPIRASVTISGDSLTVDFTGTNDEVTGFINTSIVTTTTAAQIAVLWVLGPDVPRNGGAFRTVKVVAPYGSLVNPHPTKPVTLCTLTPASEIIAAVFKAMAEVAPHNIPAGFGRYCGPSFYGIDPRNNNFYVGFAFCSLGSGGALEDGDGRPYMAPLSNFGGVRTPNIESNEVQYPHLTLCHQLETDTAGAGKFRGGPGIRYSFRLEDPSPGIVMFGDGMKIPPYGLAGGAAGSCNRASLTTAEGEICLASKENPRQLNQGDVITLISSGGGGWGNPAQRSAKLVEEDLRNEIISPKAARELYGYQKNFPSE